MRQICACIMIIFISIMLSNRNVFASSCVTQPPFGAGKVLIDAEILMLDYSLDKVRGFKRQDDGTFEEFAIGNRNIERYDFVEIADVDNSGPDEIIIADVSDDRIHVYDSSLHEITSFDAGIERYDDLAAGDVDGDGQVEIILGDASDPSGKSIRIFNINGNEIGWIKVANGYERYDRVSAGDVDGDGVDEIVHGDASDNNIHIYKWNEGIAGNFSAINQFPVDYSREDEIAVNDVDGDGFDEIIFGEGTDGNVPENGHRLVVYDLEGNIEAKSLDIQFEKSDSLAAGDIDLDGIAEIVVGNKDDGFLYVYEVGRDGKIRELASFDANYKYEDYAADIVVGDLDGGSIVVGDPVCKGQLNIDDQVVAVINAPPKHNGVNNEPGIFTAEYEHSLEQATSNTLTAVTNFSFTIGMTQKIKLKVFEAENSLSFKYAQSSKEQVGTKVSIKIGEGVSADQRDAKVSVTTIYDVYEYPVLDDDGNQQIVDGKPQFLAVNIPVSIGVPTLGYYESDLHTLGDIVSYPTATTQLLNYPGTSIYDMNFVIGPDPRQGYIKKEDSHFNSKEDTHELGIAWKASAGAMGSSLNLSGDYSNKFITTHKFEFTDTTSLKIEYSGGITDEDKYYTAHAVAYYDSEDGHFVLDWMVPSFGSHYSRLTGPAIPLPIILPPFNINIPTFMAISLPLPSGGNVFAYEANGTTIRDNEPGDCRPIDFGSESGIMDITVDLPSFDDPVDLYFGIYAPTIEPNDILLVVDNGSQLDKVSNGLRPWISFTSGNIHQSVLGRIPTALLPPGTYYFYLLASPANSDPLVNYYLWWTTYVK